MSYQAGSNGRGDIDEEEEENEDEDEEERTRSSNRSRSRSGLEAQLVEQELNAGGVLASFKISLFQYFFCLFFSLQLGVRLLHGERISRSLDINIIDRIACRHHMIQIHELEEGLDGGSLEDLLLAHGLGDLEWVSFNPAHQGVAEYSLFASFIVALYYDSLLPGESPGSKDHYLARLDKFAHTRC